MRELTAALEASKRASDLTAKDVADTRQKIAANIAPKKPDDVAKKTHRAAATAQRARRR
jgi:hypothetical protein